MSHHADVVVLLCTVPPERAGDIVDALLHERLIACANFVGPVQSRYVWKGSVEQSEEVLLVMKTCRDQLSRLRQRIVELHPYDVPELLELPVDGGLEGYLDWVRGSVGPSTETSS